MPELSLGLPLILLLLGSLLVAGGGLTYLGLSRANRISTPTPQATATISPTPSLTPTPITPTSTPLPQPSPTPIPYQVQSGDTCGGIAASFDISVQSLILANNLSAGCTLTAGQQLLIPQPTPTNTPVATSTLTNFEATLEACETDTHTVTEDDTLSSIARANDLSEEEIVRWNGLSSEEVFAGQRLVIPACQGVLLASGPATPSPVPTYAAPSLLLPADGAPFSLADDTVVLQWTSVGALGEGEAYQVNILDITPEEDRELVDEVTDTKYIIPTSFRPNESSPHVFRWWVVPVVQTGEDQSGSPIWSPSGPGSPVWVFTWSGAAPQETPQP